MVSGRFLVIRRPLKSEVVVRSVVGAPYPKDSVASVPKKVLALQSEMGFPARRAGAYDQGVPGQYFASHAERQASILEPDQPIEVSEGMCDDCQEYFQCLANYRGVGQQVTDPNGSYTFEPEG